MALLSPSPALDSSSTGQGTDSTRRRDYTRAIGTILVAAGRLEQTDVDEIRIYAGRTGMRFGDAAVQLNKATPEDIQFALARQFNYALIPNDLGVHKAVIAAHNPQCKVVEQLRTIRSRLLLGWLNEAERKVLAITSPERGEGRSWLAANLATVFAQAGKRTLLIDADLRHPQQHRMFNIENDLGLTALLTGRAGGEVAHRVHPQLRLFVVTAGQVPPNPQELLMRQIFDAVLDRYAARFDLVVLDTPAATETADAEILAAHAGAAILLMRRNSTRRAKLAQAMDSLQRSGAKVIGSVINEEC
ncbi:MAG: polysaccharide biosynthesis tyrosine autokinase [Steroidobacteraceae bacterium]|jgi:chain length determinant protein tyrosine kinase EpsG